MAAYKLDALLEYLEREWSVKTRNRFLEQFIEAAKQLSRFPESCEESCVRPGIYKAVVNKHTALYYRVVDDQKTVEIITVLDSRQNPEDTIQEIRNL